MHDDLAVADFEAADLLDVLEAAPTSSLDDLPFGMIVMDRAGNVVWYNAYESQRAGLERDRVLGRNFFESVGPCTNNYLIAQRYTDEPDLDDFIDFVFTLRMAPTPVRLRMMARADSPRQYLAVRNR
jgi:photoactive yellow protein